MPQIILEKVEKSYGSFKVLPPLDLTLNDGEFTVLVGPSGCGKSTTLRILAGLETLSGGEIYFDGKPMSAVEPKDRDIAMVFQDYALYPHMNIAKNMSFALRLQKRPQSEIDLKVNNVAEMLNISNLLDRKPGELSGGQRQRVAMGRALVKDASTFLFDEPLSNLDAKLRAKLRTELAEMRQTINKNMIYVTHDQVEAMTLGDRIVVMSDGIIQQQGSPEELFKRPVNKFVAGFMGSPTMNFLDGELIAKTDKMWVEGKGYSLPLSPALSSRLKNARDSSVYVGIRPSSFHTNAKPDAKIKLKIIVSEYLGSTSVLSTRCGDDEVLVEVDSVRPIQTGETVTFGVKAKEIMIFDRESEERL